MFIKKTISVFAVAMLPLSVGLHAQQISDPEFDVSVSAPAYRDLHPRVAIDTAHFNFHTAEGRYKPLAELLKNDGYDVGPGLTKFSQAALKPLGVLVIANARGADGTSDASKPAFTGEECNEVRDWVRAGGALLLIADHAPFGSAAWDLAQKFGVDMGKGHVFDLANSTTDPTILVFSRDNKLLADHIVTQGRNEAERVKRVVAFEGQSLSIPPGAIALMKLDTTAYEVGSAGEMDTAIETVRQGKPLQDVAPTAHSVAERAQGVVLSFGKGRVAIMGEAAMFSAQLLRQPGEPDFRFGMNADDNDDRQFALNILHWLSGAM